MPVEKPNYRKIIEDYRKSGTILEPKFFKNKEARDALYQLNKESAAKPKGSPIDQEIEKEKARKAKFGAKY